MYILETETKITKIKCSRYGFNRNFVAAEQNLSKLQGMLEKYLNSRTYKKIIQQKKEWKILRVILKSHQMRTEEEREGGRERNRETERLI